MTGTQYVCMDQTGEGPQAALLMLCAEQWLMHFACAIQPKSSTKTKAQNIKKYICIRPGVVAHTFVALALRRMEQEYCAFWVSLGYMVGYWLT